MVYGKLGEFIKKERSIVKITESTPKEPNLEKISRFPGVIHACSVCGEYIDGIGVLDLDLKSTEDLLIDNKIPYKKIMKIESTRKTRNIKEIGNYHWPGWIEIKPKKKDSLGKIINDLECREGVEKIWIVKEAKEIRDNIEIIYKYPFGLLNTLTKFKGNIQLDEFQKRLYKETGKEIDNLITTGIIRDLV